MTKAAIMMQNYRYVVVILRHESSKKFLTNMIKIRHALSSAIELCQLTAIYTKYSFHSVSSRPKCSILDN